MSHLDKETIRAFKALVEFVELETPLYIDEAVLAALTATDSPMCMKCFKHPAQIEEYVCYAEDHDMTPDEFVRREEGTYNPDCNRFACTDCYCKMGMPSSPTGWKAR